MRTGKFFSNCCPGNSFAIAGIEGYRVDAETTLLDGQPVLSIIDLGDQAVKESGDRIQAV
jgi:magnesium chelatase family protein